jgi:hypothetical protein
MRRHRVPPALHVLPTAGLDRIETALRGNQGRPGGGQAK